MALTRTLSNIAAGAIAATVLVASGTGVARAAPLTWVLHDAVFDDGGGASGQFTIDVYGYLSNPSGIVTTAGSLLSGFSYDLTNPSNIVPGTPPAIGVEFHSGSYNLTLHLEFAHPLDLPGLDPLVLGSSWECAAFTCPGPDTGSPGANTRYFTSGFAVVPEPAAALVFGASLLALGFLRRR